MRTVFPMHWCGDRLSDALAYSVTSAVASSCKSKLGEAPCRSHCPELSRVPDKLFSSVDYAVIAKHDKRRFVVVPP